VIWQIIAFAFLLFFLAKILKKPLGSFLVKRKEVFVPLWIRPPKKE
jgi:F0F1-type ATP synthase membrane subunit b/b'